MNSSFSTIYSVNDKYKKLMLDKRTFNNTQDMVVYMKYLVEQPFDDIVNLLGELLEEEKDDPAIQELFNNSVKIYDGLNNIKELIKRKNLGRPKK